MIFLSADNENARYHNRAALTAIGITAFFMAMALLCLFIGVSLIFREIWTSATKLRDQIIPSIIGSSTAVYNGELH